MWNTCTGQWCGSKYEQAYRDGYEQGWADQAKKIEELESALKSVMPWHSYFKEPHSIELNSVYSIEGGEFNDSSNEQGEESGS